MRRASASLFPRTREGYGLVVVEAAARGTPSVVVADEDNAAVELVDDGDNGVVARPTIPRRWRRRSCASTRRARRCARPRPTGSRATPAALARELARQGDARLRGLSVHVAYNLLHLVPGETGGSRALRPAAGAGASRRRSRPRDDAVPRRGAPQARTGAKASTWSPLRVRSQEQSPARARGADALAAGRASRGAGSAAQPLQHGAGASADPAGDDDPRRHLQALSRRAGCWRRASRSSFPSRPAAPTRIVTDLGGLEDRHRPLPRRSRRERSTSRRSAQACRRTRSASAGGASARASGSATRRSCSACSRSARTRTRSASSRRSRKCPRAFSSSRDTRRATNASSSDGSRSSSSATACGSWAGSTTTRSTGSTGRPTASSFRRSRRASACRCSRRCSAARPWRARTPRRSPRSPATRRSSSTRSTSRRSPSRFAGSSRTASLRSGFAPPASSGRSGSAGTRPHERTLDSYRKALGR